VLEGEPERHDAAHGLRDEIDGGGDGPSRQPHEVFEAVGVGRRGHGAEPGPVQERRAVESNRLMRTIR